MTADQDRSGPRPVVYGEIDGYLVFIPQARAHELASIHEALRFSETWDDFRSVISAEEYARILKRLGGSTFEEFLRSEREMDPRITEEEAREAYLDLSIGERLPEMDDPFSMDDIPGASDGDYPSWPARAMLSWVPESIRHSFGRVENSVINGDFLTFDPASAKTLVEAFEREGYHCVRDDDLVRRASEGY
jgi:hypothetical protein